MIDMVKVAQTSNKLTNYLSREKYNVVRLQFMDNISDSLYQSKVNQYNELVDILNPLFADILQSEDTDAYLFERIHQDDIMSNESNVKTDLLSKEEREMIESEYSSRHESEIPEYDPITGDLIDPEQARNMKSLKDLVEEDKFKSKQRVNDFLEEYQKQTKRDGSTTDPDDEEEIDVLSSITLDKYYDPSDDSYKKQTADNQQLDDNPAQILDVTTTSEYEQNLDKSVFDVDIDTDSIVTEETHFDIIPEAVRQQYLDYTGDEKEATGNKDEDDNEQSSEQSDDLNMEDDNQKQEENNKESKTYDSTHSVGSKENILNHTDKEANDLELNGEKEKETVIDPALFENSGDIQNTSAEDFEQERNSDE